MKLPTISGIAANVCGKFLEDFLAIDGRPCMQATKHDQLDRALFRQYLRDNVTESTLIVTGDNNLAQMGGPDRGLLRNYAAIISTTADKMTLHAPTPPSGTDLLFLDGASPSFDKIMTMALRYNCKSIVVLGGRSAYYMFAGYYDEFYMAYAHLREHEFGETSLRWNPNSITDLMVCDKIMLQYRDFLLKRFTRKLQPKEIMYGLNDITALQR